MEMCYDGTLVMPSSYVVMNEEEMTYTEGGALIDIKINRKTIESACLKVWAGVCAASTICWLAGVSAADLGAKILGSAGAIAKALLSINSIGGFVAAACTYALIGMVVSFAMAIAITYVTNTEMHIKI